MNEMLGNQYFMARNYLEAANAFQDVIKEEPDNINAKKKLIIALSQIGKYSKSLEMFLELIEEDVNYILNTDPQRDDCPCAELVNNLEVFTKHGDQSLTTYQTLGTLWLYCDINRSLEYFEKALAIKPNDERTNSILIILKRKKSQIDANNNLKYPS